MNYNNGYIYEQYSVQKDDLVYSIITNDYNKAKAEQIYLFNLMINFGYTPIVSEKVIFTDEQIVSFWNYGKDSVLKNMQINQYYNAFGIAPVFTSKIPTLKISGAFFSDKFELKIIWINDILEGKGASFPQRYNRNGLELYTLENELKGAISPEYYCLYKEIDEANANWSKMTKSEKRDFLVELSSISNKTKFLMPQELVSTLRGLQP